MLPIIIIKVLKILDKISYYREMLADWFAWKNVNNTIIFIQYLLLCLFRFVQLLTRMIHSNLEVYLLRAHQSDRRAIFTKDGRITERQTCYKGCCFYLNTKDWFAYKTVLLTWNFPSFALRKVSKDPFSMYSVMIMIGLDLVTTPWKWNVNFNVVDKYCFISYKLGP